MNEPRFMAPVNARWDPQVRHDMALTKIRRAVEMALGHPACTFTEADVEYVAELMGLRGHGDDTPAAVTDDGPSNRRVMGKSDGAARRAIQPEKRYRVKSTGEVITGAELLRRRNSRP